MIRAITNTLLAIASLLPVHAALAQDYPNRPIRIVTAAVGGGADIAARMIGQAISPPLGQPIVVENRAGLGPAVFVSKAPPDGYTLMVFGGTFWLAPYMVDNVPYDPVKDFAPVSGLNVAPHMLVVHPSLPVSSVKELIAYTRANPDVINCAAGAIGSATHLAAELFKTMTGIKMTCIGYKGAGEAITGLLRGETNLMFANTASGLPHVRSGKMKGLGVSTPKRTAIAPDMPTIAESGVPGYQSRSTIALFAPARTPEAIIKRLNMEVTRFLDLPATKERFLKMGVDPDGGTPEELAETVKSEMATMGKVIKDAGLRDKY